MSTQPPPTEAEIAATGETALAECRHGDHELCEHRAAALAYLEREPLTGRPFPWGAFAATFAIGTCIWIMLALAVYNVAWWLS